MTMPAHLLPCITRQRPGVDTIRGDGAAEREVVRCYIVSPYLGPASEWLDIERPGPALARAVPDDEDTD
jgi:hypothetical protein